MKMGLIAAAVGLAAAVVSGPVQARAYGYRHHHYYCGYALHYDYSQSNSLSPMSHIYPAANWGPFFQCHTYIGPVVTALPGPY